MTRMTKTPKPSPEALQIKHLIAIGMSGGDIKPGKPGHENDPPPMTEDAFRDWRRRTVAELISLPAICPVRRCRRSRRCRADDAVCLTRHREKAAERINLMMGWHVADAFDEEQDDLSWCSGRRGGFNRGSAAYRRRQS